MKAFLALILVVFPFLLRAQSEQAAPARVYTNDQSRYQVAYPQSWLLRKNVSGAEVTFFARGQQSPALAVVTLTTRPLPDALKDDKLTAPGGQDSLWRTIQRLPQAQILHLDQQDFGRYDEVRYDYTYAPDPTRPTRTHVVGRRLWRAGYAFQLEYRAAASQDGRYLAEGRLLVASFAFTGAPLASRRYADQMCDGKMYGIAAMSRRNGRWEDDCRTIHAFSTNDLTAAPVVHRRVLPFQSYALAKGFDNCLYSVTKAPTNQPELVYRYDPTKHQGNYTTWQLPAQGAENVWISASTDERGDLYFLTSDANQLVKVSPRDGGTVSVLWNKDPVRKAPYYPYIAFGGAGTHGNFCLDDANTMYLVYSTDGSLLKVDLTTQRPNPALMALTGLPTRGGYSDLLMQNDEAGRRRMYMAGPHALYKVDLARRTASVVRKGTYTDLAGCNIFRVIPRPAPVPPPPITATWRGRVLNAATYQPLPNAQLRLGPDSAKSMVPLTPRGRFAYTAPPGLAYRYRAQLAGYLTTDSTWLAAPGASVSDILLRPLAVGTTLQLSNVQFEQGQALLLPTSFTALDQLVGLMTDNPRMTIELRGHTDNVGLPAKNVVLSEERVAAVKAYLVAHGITQTRITGIGFGGARPAASNAQEVTRKLNRRVEFRVTGMQ